MSEREADIDFDFFDEPETEEAAERPRLPRRPTNGGSRGGGPPRLRTPSGFVPMVRLAGLIAFLILAVIILVFLTIFMEAQFVAGARIMKVVLTGESLRKIATAEDAGPESPPMRRPSRLSISNPPRCFFAVSEWQG